MWTQKGAPMKREMWRQQERFLWIRDDNNIKWSGWRRRQREPWHRIANRKESVHEASRSVAELGETWVAFQSSDRVYQTNHHHHIPTSTRNELWMSRKLMFHDNMMNGKSLAHTLSKHPRSLFLSFDLVYYYCEPWACFLSRKKEATPTRDEIWIISLDDKHLSNWLFI